MIYTLLNEYNYSSSARVSSQVSKGCDSSMCCSLLSDTFQIKISYANHLLYSTPCIAPDHLTLVTIGMEFDSFQFLNGDELA